MLGAKIRRKTRRGSKRLRSPTSAHDFPSTLVCWSRTCSRCIRRFPRLAACPVVTGTSTGNAKSQKPYRLAEHARYARSTDLTHNFRARDARNTVFHCIFLHVHACQMKPVFVPDLLRAGFYALHEALRVRIVKCVLVDLQPVWNPCRRLHAR